MVQWAYSLTIKLFSKLWWTKLHRAYQRLCVDVSNAFILKLSTLSVSLSQNTTLLTQWRKGIQTHLFYKGWTEIACSSLQMNFHATTQFISARKIQTYESSVHAWIFYSNLIVLNINFLLPILTLRNHFRQQNASLLRFNFTIQPQWFDVQPNSKILFIRPN